MVEKLEKKFGKYAIPNLMNYLIAGYAIGYILEFGSSYTSVNLVSMLRLEPALIINNLQLWRIISWVLLPPPQNIVFAIIMLIFYWQIGRALEQTMGSFRFNLYVFGGIIFTIIGAFVFYGICYAKYGAVVQALSIGSYFTMDYVNLGLFLAFALLYPDEMVLFWFIPMKMKYLSIIYGVLIVIDFVIANWGGRTAIISSLLNFLIFFIVTRNSKRVSPEERRRQKSFREQYNAGRDANQRYRQGGSGWGGNQSGWGNSGNGAGQNGAGGFGQGFGNPFSGANSMRNAGSPFSKPHVHKCEICGRTEITNPELEFRYCSKCKGNHEYCNDHLFTHKHIV